MSPTAFSSASIDLEAQVALPAPTRVMPDSSRTAPVAPINPTDELFGYTFSSSPRTRDSRHDSVRMSISDVPPPYVEESDVPAYTLHAPEPMTLAMYLFKFGFLFPPFWIFGALILLSPLREPPTSSADAPAWMPEKTEAERQQIIAEIRTVEVKWAKRCLWAILVLIIVSAVAAVSAWAVMRSS
ncbi:hypothetical protein K443DRAFT_683492 [Laccaria amethystina LaAM-08-1]|uniref:Transmembrane protein n=1 Tax=Laccaria amethystina LaAM-08-1 TaxID=1095629 RepID=A0A0C9WSR1_9AGAR|nr:hypothetical protein K443DRAFT_683492 [Laccaria amethystina LaAM-08-1]